MQEGDEAMSKDQTASGTFFGERCLKLCSSIPGAPSQITRNTVDRPRDFELHPDFEEHERASKGERKKNREIWRKRGRARESEGRKAKEKSRNIERTKGKKRQR